MNSIDIVYYLGVIFALIVEGWLLFVRFEEYDHIDLKEHYDILILHIFVLIMMIVVWRILFDAIFQIQTIVVNHQTFSIEDIK